MNGAPHLTNAWRHCIGTGRANLSLRQGHREALAMAQADIGFRHIRGHGLLSDDMGLLRTADFEGRRVTKHSYLYIDQMLDGYLRAGIKPILELGFMPEALASGRDTVFWWKGNITPPSSLEAWGTMIRRLLEHLLDRYGPDEVRQWPLEVWNEPNLTVFWKDADQQAYFDLYATTAQVIKEVDDQLQVGGPAISPGASHWWQPFAEFVTGKSVPLDFLAYHAYTSGDAQHVPFGTYQSLRDPEDLLRQFAEPVELLAGTGLEQLPRYVTEFNSSYRPDNPIHDTAYNAAYLAPTLVAGGDVVDSFSYWTLSDIFEEAGIPTSLYHGGFGLLTHGLVPKPTYHLYAFMARLGSRIVERADDHIVTIDDAKGVVSVLAWQPVQGSGGPTSAGHNVSLELPGRTGEYYLHRSRTNETEGNGRAAWLDMGSPDDPDRRQLELIRECAQPAREFGRVAAEDGTIRLDLQLGRHEVTLVELLPITSAPDPWADDSRLLGEDSA